MERKEIKNVYKKDQKKREIILIKKLIRVLKKKKRWFQKEKEKRL